MCGRHWIDIDEAELRYITKVVAANTPPDKSHAPLHPARPAAYPRTNRTKIF